MVADFISAEYGWCQSPDGKESAQVLFRAGKGRDGYFDNSNILEQTKKAMDIVSKHYPGENHIFIFDNARTHAKRPDASQSARRMTKNPSANFFVEINDIGPDGKLRYAPDGHPLKKKVRMANGTFLDGSEQEFYFPEGHEKAGMFKGMVNILAERGFTEAHKLKAQCKSKFSECPPGATACCC